ncbi:MAG: cell division protein FtsQ/DivIB [Gammaproteobacteria bacterium]|nr:cell division protein FtsQ/DivIB [Gammaproteobacteria bacterium]
MPRREQTILQQVWALMRLRARTLSGLLLLTLLALATVLGMRWMADPYRFPLAVVEVKGDFRYLMKEDLQAAIASHVEAGFFTVDVAATRKAAEQLPWVHKASVQRVWPETLRVQIVEQQPVAHWQESGYLNAQGEAFFPQQKAAALELPRLSGPQGQEQKVLAQYRQATQTLAALGLQVQQIALDERRAWSVRLNDDVQLWLGRAEPWLRLQRFVRAYPGVFAGRLVELQRVDLRYSNGFSVLWEHDADRQG